jgi:hypothetical protein
MVSDYLENAKQKAFDEVFDESNSHHDHNNIVEDTEGTSKKNDILYCNIFDYHL